MAATRSRRGIFCASLALFVASTLGQIACKSRTDGASSAATAPKRSEASAVAEAHGERGDRSEDTAERSASVAPEGSASGAEALCKASEKAEFPTADRPTPEEKGKLKVGDSYRYYYGINTAVDPVAARHTAFLEQARGDSLVLGGSAILMMLYANGIGVKRDIDLAIKLACSTGHAPAEIEGRVEHLNGLRTTHGGEPFDFCDDITSGYMMGHCAGLAEERKRAERSGALAKLVTNWSSEQRSALTALQAALDKFASTRASQEQDLSGSDRGSVMTEAEAAVKQGFIEAMQRFEQGKLPEYSAEDLSRADADLNQTYRDVLKRDFEGTTLTPAGIKATERTWLGYRDAWLSLASKRYPQGSRDAFATWLTLQRVEQLRSL